MLVKIIFNRVSTSYKIWIHKHTLRIWNLPKMDNSFKFFTAISNIYKTIIMVYHYKNYGLHGLNLMFHPMWDRWFLKLFLVMSRWTFFSRFHLALTCCFLMVHPDTIAISIIRLRLENGCWIFENMECFDAWQSGNRGEININFWTFLAHLCFFYGLPQTRQHLSKPLPDNREKRSLLSWGAYLHCCNWRSMMLVLNCILLTCSFSLGASGWTSSESKLSIVLYSPR